MHKWRNEVLAAKQRRAVGGPTGPVTDPGRVFLDIGIGGQPAGRVVVRLHHDVVPKTAENFRLLCTGERGRSRQGVELAYKGTVFHRVEKGFVVQGGDVCADGTSGVCAVPYDPAGKARDGHFDDENFLISHNRPGRVSMANKGPNTNNSQFFITLAPALHLDGKNVCFGDVISGMEVVQAVARLDTQDEAMAAAPGKKNGRDAETLVDVHRPRLEVKVTACGEVELTEEELDPEAEEKAKLRAQEEDMAKSVAGVKDAVAAVLKRKRRGPAQDAESDSAESDGANALKRSKQQPLKKKKRGLMDLSSDEDSD